MAMAPRTTRAHPRSRVLAITMVDDTIQAATLPAAGSPAGMAPVARAARDYRCPVPPLQSPSLPGAPFGSP